MNGKNDIEKLLREMEDEDRKRNREREEGDAMAAGFKAALQQQQADIAITYATLSAAERTEVKRVWKAVDRFDRFCWTSPSSDNDGARQLMHELAKLVHYTNSQVKEIFLRAAEQRDGRQRICKPGTLPF
jgi:hypothetical protein